MKPIELHVLEAEADRWVQTIEVPAVSAEEPHEHQYTIPVEWEFRGPNEKWGQFNSKWPVPAKKRVSKLRCVCGAETERK